MELRLIAAVADDGTIGDGGSIPWDLPDDLERFRGKTAGDALIMGRRTYDSIVDRLDSPLTDADRRNIVLTRSADYPTEWGGVYVARDAVSALGLAEHVLDEDVAWVAGGAEVYERLLPLVSEMHITRVHRIPDGDTRFPDVEWSDWSCVSREIDAEYTFVVHERASSR